MKILFERPDLKAYFYNGKPCPATDPELAQVLTVAEMFADVLDTALYTTSRIKAAAAYDGWYDYASFLLRKSDALRTTISAYPLWWPNLEVVSRGTTVETVPPISEVGDVEVS